MRKSGKQINLDNEARNELVIEDAIISDKQRLEEFETA